MIRSPFHHSGPVSPKHSGTGGLAAPKRSSVGGLVSPKLRRSEGAFTLIEIMIVVSIVTILSLLAMIAIARIKDKAARSAIANNLRQLYQAKEFYYSETGDSQPTSIIALDRKGYLRSGLGTRLINPHSFEAGQHWHYKLVLLPSKPTAAYRGTTPSVATVSENEIYYPGLPEDPANYWGSTSAGSTAATPAATQTTAPTPQGPTLPAGFVGGNHPNAPTAKAGLEIAQTSAMNGSLKISTLQNTLQNTLAASSPDGSPVEIVGIAGDPQFIGESKFIAGGQYLSLPWKAQPTDPPTVYNFTLTLRNQHGETQVPVTVRH